LENKKKENQERTRSKEEKTRRKPERGERIIFLTLNKRRDTISIIEDQTHERGDE